MSNSLDVWSSEGRGWSLQFKAVPSSFLAQEDFEPLLTRLKAILPKGVEMCTLVISFGLVFISGNEQACLNLKAQVEESGFGTMAKNEIDAALAD